jgi:hypothetical protein
MHLPANLLDSALIKTALAGTRLEWLDVPSQGDASKQ